MSEESLLERCYADPLSYSEAFLWIADKDDREVRFVPNAIQRLVHEHKRRAIEAGRPRRFLYLKYRRGGVTSYELACSFHACATRRNVRSLFLAHDDDSTEKIFRKVNLFYDKLPRELQPRRLTLHNKRNLDLVRLHSLFDVGTAGKFNLARGDTLSKVHWSEMAYSPGSPENQAKLLAGLTEAASHGEVVLESTPNGAGNLFHAMVMDCLRSPQSTPWTLIFLPWFADPANVLPMTDRQAAFFATDLTEEDRDLMGAHGLTLNQIAWRHNKKRELGARFIEEYPEDEESCFAVPGINFFDPNKIKAIARAGFPPPLRVEQIPGSREGTGGELVIFALPQRGRRYGAGGDVAGGGPAGNQSVLDIGDMETCEQMAVLRGRWKPEEFAEHAARAAALYNHALLAIEKNNHGHSTLNTLINTLHYPNLYHHVSYAGGKPEREPGWSTDGKTRPVLLSDLRDGIEKGWMKIRDRILAAQCLTFKLSRREMKYEAAEGCLDDHVIARGIFLQIRKDQNDAPVDVPALGEICPPVYNLQPRTAAGILGARRMRL